MASATACTWPCGRERAISKACASGTKVFALQRAANDLDQRIGQVRQVAQGLVLDRAAFAVAAAQQVGAIDLVLVGAGRGDDVGGSGASWHARQYTPMGMQYQLIS